MAIEPKCHRTDVQDARAIQAKLDHPIVDFDGHIVESIPVVVDYMRRVAGDPVADRFAASMPSFGQSNNPPGERDDFRGAGVRGPEENVANMAEVVGEAYELVTEAKLNSAQFKDFTRYNPIRLHGQMNAAFFDGTPVEKYARRVLDISQPFPSSRPARGDSWPATDIS